MKYTYKKVEATTEEIIKRMLDGEVLYSEHGKYCYFYDSDLLTFFERLEGHGSIKPVDGFIITFYERIEQKWYEDPEFKLPCLMRRGGQYVYIARVFNNVYYEHYGKTPFSGDELTPVPRDENGHYIISQEGE